MIRRRTARLSATRRRGRLSPCRARLGVAAILAAAVAAVPCAGQDAGSISLRHAVRVEPGRPVLLADVASLDGPPAAALAGVVLLEAGADSVWTVLDAAAVRAAIEDQAAPVWGRLALVGAEVRVRAVAPAASVETPRDAGPNPSPAPADPASVRAVIEHRLAAALECAPEDLRLEFSDRDAALLALSAIGRVVDVQPTGFSARLPLRITVYEGERIISSTAIRVGVLVRRSVAVAPAGLARAAIIRADDLALDVRWLAPDLRSVDPAEAAGLLVRARVAPGAPITWREVEAPLAVRRGEMVQVHAAGGAVSIQIPARALDAGRVGEVIRLSTLDGPAGDRRAGAREILGRIAAPGIAVIVDDAAHTQPAMEPTR